MFITYLWAMTGATTQVTAPMTNVSRSNLQDGTANTANTASFLVGSDTDTPHVMVVVNYSVRFLVE